MSRVFISYSRKDIAFVERLAKDIQNAGFEVWYDLSGLEAGKNWGKEIQEALENSQYMVVVLSPHSLESRWVEREYLFAESLNLKVIPVLYQACRLPLWTIDLHYVDMTAGSYKKHLDELLKVLGKPEPSKAQPAAGPPPVVVESISAEPGSEPVPSAPIAETTKPAATPPLPQPITKKEEQPQIAATPRIVSGKPVHPSLRKLRWLFFAVGGLVALFLFGMIITRQFGLFPLAVAHTQTSIPPPPTLSSSSTDVSGEVTLWYTYDSGSIEEKILRANIDRAARALPNVKIDTMQVKKEWIQDKYEADFSTENGPDLCMDCAEWLAEDAKKGMFLDLTDLAKDRLEGYRQVALDALTVDGKLYGLPLSLESMVMWYNKEKLPDPPQDTDALQNLMLNGTPVAMDYQCYYIYGLLTAFGAQIFDENWNVIADQGRGLILGIDYLSRLHAIARDRDWLLFESFGYGKFETESVAAVFNGTWALNEYQEKLGEKLAVAPLPKGDAGAAMPFLGVKGIYLNPKTKNPEAALEVALLLTDADSQTFLMKDANLLPAREDVNITDPLLKQLIEALFSGYTLQWITSSANLYWNNFCNYDDVFEAKITPADWVKMSADKARAQQVEKPLTFPVGTIWSSFKDLAAMMFVPQGEFIMGGGKTDDGKDQSQFTVYLDGFWIDQTEVTIAQYEQCIAAKACEGPANNPVGTGNYEEIKDLPEEGVTWKMADQYCSWVGERLPTEAEWEKAARGTDGQTYPWGEGIRESHANFVNNKIGHTMVVGSYEEGKSPYGVLDMSGNVMEWVADWYWDYPSDGKTLKNPTGPASGTIRILRGGSYNDSPENITTTVRKMVGENDTGGGVGFRCVLSVQNQFNLFEGMLKDPPKEIPGNTFWAPIWTSNYKDGKALIYIQAGNFTMGSNEDETAKPAHEVYLSAYWIDDTEISNGDYRKCEEEGACAPPKQSGSFTRPDYYLNPDYEGYPVVWVTKEMAQNYCSWAGRRLPTEAEWEKAARGPYGRQYPWGNVFDLNVVNGGNKLGDTTHIGAHKDGMSVYGVSDMAGNVWEWVADFYDAEYYKNSPSMNPTGPASGNMGILRGGCFVDGRNILQSSYRTAIALGWSEWSTGFRCAVTDPQE